jgi:CheY-like chemotaxis protein
VLPVVLLVDDHPENLTALSAVLAPLAAELDARVVCANGAEEALRHVLREGDAIAVVLLDVQMPGIDGLETARLIRQRARTGHVPSSSSPRTTPTRRPWPPATTSARRTICSSRSPSRS